MQINKYKYSFAKIPYLMHGIEYFINVASIKNMLELTILFLKYIEIGTKV